MLLPKISSEVIVNAKIISTSLLVIAAVTVLVVLAFRVGTGATADAVAVLQTSGMSR